LSKISYFYGILVVRQNLVVVEIGVLFFMINFYYPNSCLTPFGNFALTANTIWANLVPQKAATRYDLVMRSFFPTIVFAIARTILLPVASGK
jgi:hypothetical protein